MRSTAVGASWSLEMRSRLSAEPDEPPGGDGGAGWVGAPAAETAQRIATAAVVKWIIVAVVSVLMGLQDSNLEMGNIKEFGVRCCS